MLISIRSLKTVINEVLVYDKDFNSCLFEALLNEGFNLSSLASRATNKGKALVKHDVDGDEFVIVVSKDEDGLKVTAAAIGETAGGGWWRLKYLYSDELSSTMLALLGALSVHSKVLPDLDVSQAAEKLIKTYFDKSKDDPSLVTLDADETRKKDQRDQGPEREHLRAGYLAPPDSSSVVDAALVSGNELIEDFAKESGLSLQQIKDDLAENAISGFTGAYSNPEKTGSEQTPKDITDKISAALANGNFKEATKILQSSYQKKASSKKTWIVNWLRDNEGEIISYVKKFLKNPQQGAGLGDFDTFISDLVEKELGQSGYSVVDASM